ncbi:MAG TPA: phospholipase, partial [Ignavibacteria bacterium]|nr:phospholipase [Ignavibacteria bacterium]
NLLEIKGNTHLAQIYLCEFMRLYEHYKARASYKKWEKNEKTTYKLTSNSSWSKKYYKKGTPEFKSRVNMAN